MIPSVVLNAEKRGSNSDVVGLVAFLATAINGQGKCIPLSVLLVAKRQRYLLSPEKGDQCIVATATLRLDAEPVLRQDNTKERGWHNQCHPLLFFS